MKFYYKGRLVRVDMVHRYQYVVVEGEDRIRSFQKTQEDAESVADGIRADIDKTISRFETALRQDEVTRMREPTGFVREIWQNYQCHSEIAAAIRRMRRRRDSIRVVPLEIRN